MNRSTDNVADITFEVHRDDYAGHEGYFVRAIHPRLGTVGHLSSHELITDRPYHDLLDDDEGFDFRLLPEAHAQYQKLTGGRMRAFGVRNAHVDRRFRGEALGQRMYLELAKTISKHGGVLCSNDAYEQGGTSLAAQRVWQRLHGLPGVMGGRFVVEWVGPDSLLDAPLRSRRSRGWKRDPSVLTGPDWRKDMEATCAARFAMEFPTEAALEKYLKEHPGADKTNHEVSEPSVGKTRKFLDGLAAKKKRFTEAFRVEMRETRELGKTLGKLISGAPVTSEERKAAIRQTMDIFKMLVVGVGSVAPVPGASLVYPVVVSAVNKVFGKNYEWAPSAFGSPVKNAGTADPVSVLMDAVFEEMRHVKAASRPELKVEWKSGDRLQLRYMGDKVTYGSVGESTSYDVVGGLNLEMADVPLCETDLAVMQETVPDARVLVVFQSFLQENLRGGGLGRDMYERALKEAAERGFVIAPNGCWHRGMTSPEASRIWASLKKRHFSVGDLVWGGPVSSGTVHGRRAGHERTAEKRVRVYHASPDADIQRFRGFHSPKFGQKGLFVAPSVKAILRSWVGWASGKRKKPTSLGGYKNVTVYTLSIPASFLEEAGREHDEAARTALGDMDDYGTWGWDDEVFLPERMLSSIRIVGRETHSANEFFKHPLSRWTQGQVPPSREEVTEGLEFPAKDEWVALNAELKRRALVLPADIRQSVQKLLGELLASAYDGVPRPYLDRKIRYIAERARGLLDSVPVRSATEFEIVMDRVAARYKSKKKVETKDGDTAVVYEYSDKQIQHRGREKAERLEKLRKNIGRLRKAYRSDLHAGDEKTRYTALVVALCDTTYERVGNPKSAEEGHFGVTGWKKEHITFGKGRVTIRYVGKSGVDQEKVVTDAVLVEALKKAVEGKKPGDSLCEGDECRVTAADVNVYLKDFDVTAKDLRGFGANTEMKTRLKAVRKGKLPEDKKEREKKLKDEFEKALEETAAVVGHTTSILADSYLVPGLEEQFLKDGTVAEKMDKKGSLRDELATRRVATRHVNSRQVEAGLSDWLTWIAQPFKVILKHHRKFVSGPVDDALDAVFRDLVPKLVTILREREVDEEVDGFLVRAREGRMDRIAGIPAHPPVDDIGVGGYVWGYGNAGEWDGRQLPTVFRRQVVLEAARRFAHRITEEVLLHALKKVWHALNPMNTARAVLVAVKKHGWKLGVGLALFEVMEHFVLPTVLAWLTGNPNMLVLAGLPLGEVVYAVALRVMGRVPDEMDRPASDGHLDWFEDNFGEIRSAALGLSFRLATKSDAEKEEDEVGRLVRPSPENKPPRHDLRRERMHEEDEDTPGTGVEGDKDLSLNYKKVAVVPLRRPMKLPTSKPTPTKKKHKPGDVWKNEKGTFSAKNQKGTVHTFEDKDRADAYAKGKKDQSEKREEGNPEKGTDDKGKEKNDEGDGDAEGDGKDESDDEKAETRTTEQRLKVKRENLDRRVEKLVKKLRNSRTHDDEHEHIQELFGGTKGKGKGDEAAEKKRAEFIAKLTEALDAEEASVVDTLKEKGVTKDMMRGAESDPYDSVDWNDPKSLAEALVRETLKNNILTDPSHIGGKSLSSVELSDEDLTKRGEESYRQFEKASPAVMRKALNSAAKKLPQLDPESPEAKELRMIVRGIGLAAQVNGDKSAGNILVDGKSIVPPVTDNHRDMLKTVLKDNPAGLRAMLSVEPGQEFGADGRRALRTALETVSVDQLEKMSSKGAWAPLSKILGDVDEAGFPKIKGDVRAFVETLIRDMIVDEMTVVQGLQDAAAGKKPDLVDSPVSKTEQHVPEVDSGDDKDMADLLECMKDAGTDPDRVKDCQSKGKGFRKKRLMGALKDAEDKAGKGGLDPRHPAVAAIRHIGDTDDMSVLEEPLPPSSRSEKHAPGEGDGSTESFGKSAGKFVRAVVAFHRLARREQNFLGIV